MKKNQNDVKVELLKQKILKKIKSIKLKYQTIKSKILQFQQ